MSFADELKTAKARMIAQKDEEKKNARKSPARKKAGTRTRTSTWLVEDEVIAMYLELSGGSKFLTDNYARKRKVSLRAMQMRMGVFGEMAKGRIPKGTDEQTKSVYKKYQDLEIGDLQKIVISILRGENTPEASGQKSEASPEAVLRKSES